MEKQNIVLEKSFEFAWSIPEFTEKLASQKIRSCQATNEFDPLLLEKPDEIQRLLSSIISTLKIKS